MLKLKVTNVGTIQIIIKSKFLPFCRKKDDFINKRQRY